MTPEEITSLRKDLRCTARELAVTLGLEQETVLAWEKGELFPTKRYVEAMRELAAKGPTAIARKPKRGKSTDPFELLADPTLWALVRKLIAHPALRDAVTELAKTYDDPGDKP